VAERRLLDSSELFRALPPDVIERLRTLGKQHALDKGELLFAQADPSHELFLVVEGRIAVSTRSTDGRESMVAVLEQGGLFGELGLFDDEPRSAEARALSDSEVFAVQYEDVRKELREHPEVLWVVVRILAQRLRATDEALADAVFLDVPARTAKRMLELAGDADEFRLPMTQEDLASLVGASRERVNKAIAMFTKLGWVEASARGKYKIIDREQLELRANP
jgi:CRP/FNR family transcriptional regulator, cyclic AMP receptor protein